ncbi:hypothetical protein LOK49_LG13G00725 [Camellia lanceoleosa]|uniref:Uncharacterized protein n=1 Tax=Camellia lanceoleosa TaxID=1840588 RepID=A0ACC0FKB9_9ERIC|nr:hypothetical protein LOK49_LG13G00725 [Camellia lanceoleosa]
MLAYAHETQHEKIIRRLALGIALTVYGREEEADTLIEQMTRDQDPILRYGDPALERRFQPVKVPEPTVDETIQILKGLRERYEIHHKLRLRDEALVSAKTTAIPRH